MNSKKTKEDLLQQCQNYVDQRRNRVQDIILDIQESLTSETKSSAGDKHETGRAMLQLEREKAGKQLAEVQKLQEIIDRIVITPSTQICLGSLITTSQANYFLSISVGKIISKNTPYYAIAANSPIGKLLIGKTIGDTINFNGNTITINSVD
ncbi:GreA/GreB family elongation factor [Aquimarina pacifica]|uniref:3-oxoacyl-ACP synthase n=1 Tax=Aquimarina pacifica TaxID=1296415 RepID=UPI0004709FFF|nr:3-oxoacyl-ACP synthase [Aquimarina pacifica]